MAYVKPGVQITQIAASSSPTLIAPDLVAAVVAPAYQVVPSDGPGSYNYGTASSTQNTLITFSGLTNNMYLDKNSVYVDLVVTNAVTGGLSAGSRLSLQPSQFNISNGATSFILASGLVSTGYNGAKIFCGYRAMRTDLGNQFLTLDSQQAYNGYFGSTFNQQVWDNPLPFALSLAGANTGTAVYGVAIKADDYSSVIASGTILSENQAAMQVLSTNEVYAIAPYTEDPTTLAAYQVHVDTLSQPINKKERIAFLAPQINWYTAGGAQVYNPYLADNPTTANNIQNAVYSVLDKRVFYVYPDCVYFAVSNCQIQKINPTFINNMYNLQTNECAILNSQYTLTDINGNFIATYNPGTIITAAVWAVLASAANVYQYDVLIPMPGCFLAACIAGQVSGENPEQGFTNLPFAGPTKLKYSNDWFTESQLNQMETGLGGAYIIVQVGNSVFARHQLSTNATTVEYRELSITKSVDYTAKFIRNTVVGYIGRSLITPTFITALGTIINGLGVSLTKNGHLNSFTLTSLAQDSVSLDQVDGIITVVPMYPVDYIDINLVF